MKIKNSMALFWGTSDVFSNWHRSPFVLHGIAFNCTEQYMMWRKAMRFGDTEIAAKVLAEKNPRKQKALGREVRSYVDAVWKTEARDLMLPAIVAKFEQNPSMDDVLLGTNDLLIVEASPDDVVWGVGLGESDPRILDQASWLGTNFLGDVLMRARDVRRAARAKAPLQRPLV